MTDADVSDPRPVAGAPARRRRLWPLLLVVVVALGADAAVSALRLRSAAHEISAGVAAVDRARSGVGVDRLSDGALATDVHRAASHFALAQRQVSGPWLTPLAHLPYIGRQLQSVRALSSAASVVVGSAASALDDVRTTLGSPHQTAGERSALVGHLAATLSVLDDRIKTVPLGPDRALLPALASRRATFAADLTRLQSGLQRASAAAAATARLLEGPSTYVVLAANNAEMRDGSGMFLQVGTVTFDHGTVKVGAFQPSSELSTNQPPVPLSGDLAALWGYEQPNQEWRNLGLSPQFPLNAPVAAAMWTARSGQHVDGVLAVDDAALAGILSVTGPVTSNGTSYTSATAVHRLLIDQYAGLSSSDPANVARKEGLGVLARDVLGHLQTPGISVSALARQLDVAANGRHILLWAADGGTEAQWRAAGVGGVVSGPELLLGVSNQGANKLDPYLQVHASLTFRPVGTDTDVAVAVSVHNDTPTTVSGYAGDGIPGPRLAYNGVVALDVPASAGRLRIDGPVKVVASGPDGAAQVLAATFAVPTGQTAEATWHFVLAGHHGILRIDPTARLPAVDWTAGAVTYSDGQTHAVRW